MRPSVSRTRISRPAPATSPPPAGIFVVRAGHPGLEFLVPAGAQDKGGKAQSGRCLPHLLGWLEDLGTVLGPQLVDGLAAPLGVWLVPDRHVAADQILGVDRSHDVSIGVGVSVSSFDGAGGPRGEVNTAV